LDEVKNLWPRQENQKSAHQSSSSWWNERGKIMSMRSEAKNRRNQKKKVKTKKASKGETGQLIIVRYADVKLVCASDSSGEIVCCGELCAL